MNLDILCHGECYGENRAEHSQMWLFSSIRVSKTLAYRPLHLLKVLLIKGKVTWIVIFLFLIHGVENKENTYYHTLLFLTVRKFW